MLPSSEQANVIERCLRILAFEAGRRRRSPVQARTRREIPHSKKKIRLKVIGVRATRKKESRR
jgi:hypothetical protein